MPVPASAVSPTAANLAGSLRAGIVRYGPSTYLAAGAVQGRSPGTVAAPVGSRQENSTPLLGATVHTDRLSYYTPPLYPYIYTVVRPTVSVRSTSVPRI